MVASVAAGKQEKSDTSPMHGVAFEANVLFIAIQLAEPDPDYDPVDLGTDDGSGNVTGAPDFTGIDNFFSSLFEVYNQYDVDIVNNSYGYSGNIIDYTEAQVRNAFPKTIAEMSQIGTPDSQKTIYVWAAGNAGGYADQGVDFSSPELLPGMAHYIPEIQGHSIAVASVDENGLLARFLADVVSLRIIAFLHLVGGLLQRIQLRLQTLASTLETQMTITTIAAYKITRVLL